MLENTMLLRLHKHPWEYGYRDETFLEIVDLLGDTVTITKGQYKDTVLEANYRPELEDCVAEFPWSKAESELAVFIIAKGDTNGDYGINIDGNTTQDLAELVIGGVNWDRSRAPFDDVWSIWGGTFHEDSRENKLSVRLEIDNDDVCYRPWEREKVFGIDMPSISDILKSASGFFLEQL